MCEISQRRQEVQDVSSLGYGGAMFTNGHHHSLAHVALAIARYTCKIRAGTKEQGKWSISA